MSVKSFWLIVLKIIGIWFVLDSFLVIEQLISSVILSFFSFNEDYFTTYLSLLLFVIIIVVFFILLRLFLFKPQWLIKKLKLDQDFDSEKIDFTADKTSIVRVAIIIIGAMLFIDSFPKLISQSFNFFQQKSIFRESPTSVWIILETVKCIIAYLLINNNKSLSEFIDRKSE
ncbi:MAG: hypothetical protein ACK5B9_02225 [Flavobacteriia bacterium]|jgi:hypothetical protein